MSIVTRKLVAKELHVNRWFLVGASLAAVLSASAATFGKTAFNIGALAWITTVIALGVMLAIYGVMHERKERSLEFVLSLPLSVGEYVRAKLLGLLLSFLLPWLVSTLAVVVLVLADADVPDGLLPYTLLLCMFLLANFSLVLCGTLHANSEAMTSAVIIVTNMLVSVFMFTVGVLPGLRNSMFGAVPVWNETFWTVLIAELLVFVIALTLPLFIAARRRDFI
jgi:ABC-type transport system involved in multi-copper enzyme maturation permease subunit